jgi:hypothetical protein
MRKPNLITGYCAISKDTVAESDSILYTGDGTGFMEFSNAIYKKFNISYPKFYKMDNLCKLGFLSAELLLRDKKLDKKYSGEEVGIILMNSSSSLETDRHYQSSILNRENYFPSPSIFVYTLPNVVIGEICIRHKFYGEGNFFIAEKFNSSFLVNYVDQLFDSEAIECCVAGWVEFDGEDYKSIIFLIEKPDKTDVGNVNFEPAIIQSIYEKIN